ncbi:acyl carrier protein [Telmatospirillum siberiense]|uniref:Acyl carrier protein n=1 Tax=Telmatospirillum siberiense TaxID=382514 RepID=A0A2N3PNV9_9PROT|nr:acyl carrier protein [Telmatospirillum siberiense]PKU22085.1 acyl carrier protein [Telmatospirillum siberiense]
MQRESIVKVVGAVIGKVVSRDIGDASENTALFDDINLDSTSILEVLLGLEDEFRIEIDPDDLDMDSFRTIGSLADYVEARRPLSLGGE